MAEGQDAMTEERLEAEAMDISQNFEYGERQPTIDLVAIVALTQVRKATSGLKTR